MLASLQSSQPCDEIPSRVAADIITGNGLQGRGMREMKWILLMGKHSIRWDMGAVDRDESRDMMQIKRTASGSDPWS